MGRPARPARRPQVEGARIELDCAHGTIEGAIALEHGGRFRAEGRLQREGGPAMAQGEDEGRPAQYSGVLKGAVLTLTVLKTEWAVGPGRAPAVTTREIGRMFLGSYLLPFEAASILLLVALMGAAMIVRRRKDA